MCVLLTNKFLVENICCKEMNIPFLFGNHHILNLKDNGFMIIISIPYLYS